MKIQTIDNISIPHDKWIHIYNSLLLLMFFKDEYLNNRASIEALNERYNKFCSEKKYIGENHSFYGGTNMLSFCYLIIARIIEIINIAFNNDVDARKQFFKYIIETAKRNRVMSFDDIKKRYCIDIQTFTCSEESDEEKLYQLFKHIRHSISHYSYEIDINHQGQGEVSFKSEYKNTVNLDMTMPMHEVLNLTGDFGVWINDVVHQKYRNFPNN